MELITSHRRQETALAKKQHSQQPWAIAIRQKYGELPEFSDKFTPAVQKYCAANIAKAVDDDLPTFGRIVATYGEEGVALLIKAHMTEAILRLGEDRDADLNDIQFISEAICESERFRLLRFPSIFAFFHLLKCGEFDIYGKVTPRKILEAFRKYAVDQQAKENRLVYERDTRLRREEEARHAAEAISWEEYASRHGIPEECWETYAMRLGDYQEERIFRAMVADLVQLLTATLTFVAEWQRQHNTA